MIEMKKHVESQWFYCNLCSHIVEPENVAEHLQNEKHKANKEKCITKEREFWEEREMVVKFLGGKEAGASTEG